MEEIQEQLSEYVIELEHKRLEADLVFWIDQVILHSDCEPDCLGHQWYRAERKKARKAYEAFKAKYDYELGEDDYDVLQELEEGEWFV